MSWNRSQRQRSFSLEPNQPVIDLTGEDDVVVTVPLAAPAAFTNSNRAITLSGNSINTGNAHMGAINRPGSLHQQVLHQQANHPAGQVAPTSLHIAAVSPVVGSSSTASSSSASSPTTTIAPPPSIHGSLLSQHPTYPHVGHMPNTQQPSSSTSSPLIGTPMSQYPIPIMPRPMQMPMAHPMMAQHPHNRLNNVMAAHRNAIGSNTTPSSMDSKPLTAEEMLQKQNEQMLQSMIQSINASQPHMSPNSHIIDAKEAVKKLIQSAYDDETEDLSDFQVPETLEVQLLPHQIRGVMWMLHREKDATGCAGGILADDMGLGKTVQALALTLLNPPPRKIKIPRHSIVERPLIRATLIVCPVALVEQWRNEIYSKTTEDSVDVLIHHGLTRSKDWEEFKYYDYVITTYGCVASEYPNVDEFDLMEDEEKGEDITNPDPNAVDAYNVNYGNNAAEKKKKTGKRKKRKEPGPLFEVTWWRIILDEAHKIKNRRTAVAVGCVGLYSDRRWCLTGTPLQNNVEELYSLFKFLEINPYCDWTVFSRDILKPLALNRGKVAIKRLQAILKAVMLRRQKTVILGNSLPTKHSADIGVTMTESEKIFYTRLEAKLKNEVRHIVEHAVEHGWAGAYTNILKLLLRLRQACCHPFLVGEDGENLQYDLRPPSSASTEDEDGDVKFELGGCKAEPYLDLGVLGDKVKTEGGVHKRFSSAKKKSRQIFVLSDDEDSEEKEKKEEKKVADGAIHTGETTEEEDNVAVASNANAHTGETTEEEDNGMSTPKRHSGETTENEDNTDPSKEPKDMLENMFTIIGNEGNSKSNAENQTTTDNSFRDLTHEEKQELSRKIVELEFRHLLTVVDIIRSTMPDLRTDEDVELDVEKIDKRTLWQVYNFVESINPNKSHQVKKEPIAQGDVIIIDDDDSNEVSTTMKKRQSPVDLRPQPKARKISHDSAVSIKAAVKDEANVVPDAKNANEKPCDICQSMVSCTPEQVNEDATIYCDFCTSLFVNYSSMLRRISKTDGRKRKMQKLFEKDASAYIPSSKITQTLELLDQIPEGEKVIVFSQFVSMLDILEVPLRKRRVDYVRYDGSMNNELRESSLHEFRTNPDTKIMLVSLMCGSLGLNLVCANHVILTDLWWNPQIEEQAIDRVHRIGQSKEVTVKRLTIAGTVEDRILKLQETKRELAREALGEIKITRKRGQQTEANRLTMEDLLTLFDVDDETRWLATIRRDDY